ncbi:MAG: hypothetical protein ACJAV5_001905 [Vicingaceae bacterium]|jgi:hypothetical protein
MNFDELKKTLSLSGTNFSLKSSQLGSPSIHALLTNFLLNGELHMQAAKRSETADQVIIEGTLTQEFLGIFNPTAKASFSCNNEQAEVQIELTGFPVEWKLSNSFPSLKNSLSDNFSFSTPQFKLDSQLNVVFDKDFQTELGLPPTSFATTDQLKQGLSFQSSINYTASDTPISGLLGLKELTLSGAVAYLGEFPILRLEADLVEQTIGPFSFPFKLQLISLLKSYDNTSGNSYSNAFARLQCTFQKTTETTTLNFPIGASIYGTDPSMLLINSHLEKSQEIKFADLATLFGGKSVDHILSKGFPDFENISLYELSLLVYLPTTHPNSISIGLALNKKWEIFSKLIKFHDLKADLTLDLTSAKPEVSAKVSAKADIANATIDGYISLPEQTFACYLEEGKNINISDLVADLLPQAPELPHLDCTEFEISGDVINEHYHMMANLKEDWSLQVGTGEFVLQNTLLVIDKTKTDIKLQINGNFDLAGIGFHAVAHYDYTGVTKGWTFNAYADIDAISLRLIFNALMQLVDVQLPTGVPDINITGLSITFNTISKDFSFTAETETEIAVPFLTGDEAKIHAIVHVESGINPETGKREVSGFMEGDFTIDSSVFTLQYSIGKEEHIFEASWESKDKTNLLGINTFLDKMGISNISDELKIPKNTDLNLKKIYLRYQAEKETLQLVADSASYGEVFLIASKLPLGQAHPDQKLPTSGSAKWEYVFGWNYEGVLKFSDILSNILVKGSNLKAVDQFHLESVGMIISSTDIKQFAIPDMPAMKAVGSGDKASAKPSVLATKRKPVAQGNVIPLGKGLALVATMDLDQSGSDGKMVALRKLVPDPKLTTLLSVDLTTDNFSIAAILQNSINIPTGQKSDLKLTNPTLSFDFNKEVTFFIFGDLSLHFDHKIIDVRPELFISEKELGGNIDFKFSDGWKKPMGIQGVTIDEFDFQIGVDFEPPAINIGLEGQSHIADQPVKSDDFTFVLEIIEEVPDPLMFSFYLQEIDVKTAMKVFVPKVDAASLPKFIKETTLTDVSFYWAQQAVVIPDGTIAQPGLGFSGNLKVLDFEAHAALAIDQGSGISGEFEMSPINFLNILAITGNGKGVYLNKKDGKIIHSKAILDKDQTGIESVPVVPPGGPTIKFQTTHSPFLKMSLKVSFLDLLNEEIEAFVSDESISFLLKYEIGELVHADLNFALNKAGFSLHSKFGMHLKTDIGPIKLLGVDFGSIHIDTGFDLVLDISTSIDHFELKLNGEFDFEGARLHFPEITISFALKSLTELPGIIIEHLIENAGEIFAALLEDAGKLLEDGIKEVGKIAEEGAKEVAQIAVAGEQEAEKIVAEASQAIEQGVEEVAKEATKVEQEAEQILTDAGKEVEKIGVAAAQEVQQIGKTIAHVAEEAEQEVEQIGSQIAQEAEQVGQEVGKLADEAVQEVGVIAEAVEQEVGKVLEEAKKVADAVVDTAKEVVTAIGKEAKALWDEAGKLAEAIADAAKAVVHAVEHTAKNVWHAITKY